MDLTGQCTPLPGAKVLTDGMEPILNRSTVPAVIDKVALTDPKGLRVIRAYVVSNTGVLYGVGPGYPASQARGLGSAFKWSQRQAAHGACVLHGTRMNLLLVIKQVDGVARGNSKGHRHLAPHGASHYHF